MGILTSSKAFASENAQVQNFQEIKIFCSPLIDLRKNGKIGHTNGALTKIRDINEKM